MASEDDFIDPVRPAQSPFDRAVQQPIERADGGDQRAIRALRQLAIAHGKAYSNR